jgi:Mg-chelatase subunit ChlD
MATRTTFLFGLLCLGVASLAVAAASHADEQAPVEASSAPRLDVVFCVDTTGSMADEIDVVKQKMREMVAVVAAGKPTPDVRFGLVIYRDRGDEYVTKRYELTRDIDQVVADINGIVARGGGDYPESVNEALHVAVDEMNWDLAEGTGRLLFWIADAPPHLDYDRDCKYEDVCAQAERRAITINTIACSGLCEPDRRIFQQVASLTGGTADELTYMRQYAKADGTTERVVSAGTRFYALAEAVGSGEWREGADVLAGRGGAKALSEAEAGAWPGGGAVAGAVPGRAGGHGAGGMPSSPATGEPGAPMGAAGPAGPGGAGGAAGAGMSPSAAAVSAESNNLDYLLTKQVQQQLARQGVRFSDQPYLMRSEWRGGTCDEHERKALVIRTEEEWKRVWALVAATEGHPEPSTVDFTRDMVLAAFGGEGLGGRTVRIADVWQDAQGLHVRVERGTEDAKARAPYHLIVVSKHQGKVVWK